MPKSSAWTSRQRTGSSIAPPPANLGSTGTSDTAAPMQSLGKVVNRAWARQPAAARQSAQQSGPSCGPDPTPTASAANLSQPQQPSAGQHPPPAATAVESKPSDGPVHQQESSGAEAVPAAGHSPAGQVEQPAAAAEDAEPVHSSLDALADPAPASRPLVQAGRPTSKPSPQVNGPSQVAAVKLESPDLPTPTTPASNEQKPGDLHQQASSAGQVTFQ